MTFAFFSVSQTKQIVGNPEVDAYPCLGVPTYSCGQYTSISGCQQAGCVWSSFSDVKEKKELFIYFETVKLFSIIVFVG